MKKDYHGKHVWIIGASSGIGFALAQELAAQGAVLALSARSEEKLNDLNKLLGGDHLVCPMDVSDERATKEALSLIQASFPKLDSAIFLAAIYSPHNGEKKEIGFIHEMLHVNVGGAFNMIDAVQPFFETQKFGQIVLCGSVAGYRGLPTGQPYCATKAAIINLAESLKVDLAPKNIDVKVICPGFVKTPLTDKNDFEMPMMIEADEAARAIAKGVLGKGFEIHFPKRFTYIMKFLKFLPYPLYFWLAGKMINK